jgi:hypothetical protein
MIHSDDLRTFSGIGKAFWIDSGKCEQSTVETLSAVSLLGLTPERALEKACATLLEQARRSDAGKEVSGEPRTALFLEPFYRLSLEERFLLVGMHIGKWSYSRVGRILNQEPFLIEEWLWKARVKLACSLTPPSMYPAGPVSPGPNCPRYKSTAPWTQRFFDGEFPPQGQGSTFRRHLGECESCSQALKKCRSLYFRVDSEIKGKLGILAERNELARTMEEILRLSPTHVRRTERTWKEFLMIFLNRRETQIAGVMILGIVLARLIQH